MFLHLIQTWIMSENVTLDLQEMVWSAWILIWLSSYFGMGKVCTSSSENLGSNTTTCRTEKNRERKDFISHQIEMTKTKTSWSPYSEFLETNLIPPPWIFNLLERQAMCNYLKSNLNTNIVNYNFFFCFRVDRFVSFVYSDSVG